MRDTLTGCLERQTEPREGKKQSRSNYLYDLQEAETDIRHFLEDYKGLLPWDMIQSFLTDIRIFVSDEMEGTN